MTAYTLFGQPGTAGSDDSYTGTQTNGLKFSVSSSCQLTGIWYSSPSGCTELPDHVGLYNNDTAALVFEDASPSWSGAAGSGWIKYTPSSPPALTAGVNYMACAAHIAADGSRYYAITAGYWTGSGAANGPLSCPDIPNYWDESGVFALPAQAYGNYNIWIDVEVSTGVSGTGAVDLKKMTVSGSGEVLTSYTVWNDTLPDAGTQSTTTGPRNDSLIFTVSENGTLKGIAFYVPSGETTLTGSSYTAALYTTTTGTSGTLITSQAGSGTFTAGAWNWIPLNVSLSPGTTYSAVINSPNSLQFEHTWWSGGPGGSGFVVGPINVPSQAAAPGLVQQGFLAGALAYPSSANPQGSWYGIDVKVAVPVGSSTSGTAAVTLKKMTVGGSGNIRSSGTGAVTLKKVTAAGSGHAEIQIVQQGGWPAVASQGTGTAQPFTIPTVDGRTILVIGLLYDDAGVDLTNVTDNGGNTYTFSTTHGNQNPPYINVTDGSSHQFALFAAWCIGAAPASSVTLDFTNPGEPTGATFVRAAILELAGAGSVDAASCAQGVNAGPYRTVLNLTDPNDFLIAVEDAFVAGTPVNPSSWTGTTGSGSNTSISWDKPGTTGTYDVDFSSSAPSSSDIWGTLAVAFKPVSTGSSVTGTGAVTLKKMTASGTGTAPLIGTAAITLKKMVASGSGKPIVFGSAAVSLRKLQVSGRNYPLAASSFFIFSPQ